MATKCVRPDASGGFRPWPVFSVAALGRKLLEAMACGGASAASSSPSRYSRGRRSKGGTILAPPPERNPCVPDRLGDLLKADASESGSEEAETMRKFETLEELQLVVGRLQANDGRDGAGEENGRKEAASEVRRLAKDDSEARETLAMLGVIPPLIVMLDSKDPELQIASLYALLNLGIGNNMNKEAIVKAGAIHKMLHLMDSDSSPAVRDAIVANFLGLSASDINKPIIGASGAIPFLLSSFENGSKSTTTAREDALRAIFNLSIAPSNATRLVDAGLVPALLAAIGDMSVSERALTVLSNIIAAGEGRRALSQSADAFPLLVDVLSWGDAPGCQEKAAYVLMVMAHKGYADRAAMVEAGVVSALLELTLLGSPLAQKRASRLLEVLTVNKGKTVTEVGGSGVSAVSAPQFGTAAGTMEVATEEGMSEDRMAVKGLVQQSLQSNMRRIVRRANLPQDFAPSERFRALTATSTSKSLPF